MNKMAFPSVVDDGETMSWDRGMTLRDYFAAKAMQSFTNEVGWKSDQKWFDEIAEGAYRQADAMMKAREQ
jgi:hypothetical protein